MAEGESAGGLDLEREFEECFSPLYRFVRARMPGDAEAASDIVQECFVALAAGSRDPSGPGAFRARSSTLTWLCAVARRKIADAYRQELRAARRSIRLRSAGGLESGAGSEVGNADPEAALLGAAGVERVRSCLAALPPEQCYALVLKYMDDLSEAELARALGKTVKATESLLGRASLVLGDLPEGGMNGRDARTRRRDDPSSLRPLLGVCRRRRRGGGT